MNLSPACHLFTPAFLGIRLSMNYAGTMSFEVSPIAAVNIFRSSSLKELDAVSSNRSCGLARFRPISSCRILDAICQIVGRIGPAFGQDRPLLGIAAADLLDHPLDVVRIKRGDTSGLVQVNDDRFQRPDIH